MKIQAALLALCLLIGAALLRHSFKHTPESEPPVVDYFWLQRAFPFQKIPTEAYYQAVAQVRDRAYARGGGWQWEFAGPNNVSGRVTDLAMHASDPQTIYTATATGGVWKSIDAGENWFPVTDGLPTLSIGDIAIAPSDKNTIYCGTGEPNAGGGSTTYDGRGVFKSVDGGTHWTAAGLETVGSIGRIEVDPLHPDKVFVAAMGHLYENNPERGVFRSLDGGMTWENKLFVNDSTGAVDLAINPLHPDTLFAVTWQRTRRLNTRVYGGAGCGVWRSMDGGDTWQLLGGGLPSGPSLGRMGIALAPSNPNVLYLTVANVNGGFTGVYKSINNGTTWSQLTAAANPGYSSYGWWFGQIKVDPNNENHVYNLGVDWLETLDGGASWFSPSPYLHSDYHAFYMHPANPDLRIVGNDGGVYLSSDGGISWEEKPLPTMQFYSSEIDFQHPDSYSGGAQDNGTWSSMGNGMNWQSIYGGDGFITLVNPQNNSIYYAESQYGGFGGSNGASAPTASRYNWITPYIFDPNNPNTLYFGAERLFKSEDGGLSWQAISGDLSNGNGGSNGVVFGTITTIAASALDEQVVTTGTDDGNVWVTENGGATWNKVSATLPKRWVTRVVTDLWEPKTIYVCLSGFKNQDNMAHVYKSNNLGQSWTDISGDLPDIPVNDLILDPLDAQRLYLATDVGVFATENGGQTWQAVNDGLPLAPVTDLTFHAPTRKLLAATFGRSMYTTTVPLPESRVQTPNVGITTVSPNPFISKTTLKFASGIIPAAQVALYDLSGRNVLNIYSGALDAGMHEFEINGSNLPAGVYLAGVNEHALKKVLKTK